MKRERREVGNVRRILTTLFVVGSLLIVWAAPVLARPRLFR